MKKLNTLIGKDFSSMKAGRFQDEIFQILKETGDVKKEYRVDYIYGKGRIDLYYIDWESGETIGLELDRKKPRIKSVLKLKKLKADKRFIITRSPFTIHEIKA